MTMRGKTALVTGFPSTFVAVRVVRQLLHEHPRLRVRCLVPERFEGQAATELDKLEPGVRDRVSVIEGDIASMDLGLSGQEFNALASEIDFVHHCAAVTFLGVNKRMAKRVNLGGAREIVELAEAADHLEKVVYWSTAQVAGARRGYVLEEELSAPAGFRNAVEETRFQAERVIRSAVGRVPTTILRPSIVVGDSVTGEIDRLEGPYLLIQLMLNAPMDLRMPLPGRGDIPLNLVPIDYAVTAGLHIAADPRSLGRTFHIVDPDPLTAKRVFELVARATGRPLPRGFLPTPLATALLRTPGLERFAHVPRAFLEQVATEVVYDDRNTRELLAGTNIACPPFESYVDVLVKYVKARQSERPAARVETPVEEYDPLG